MLDKIGCRCALMNYALELQTFSICCWAAAAAARHHETTGMHQALQSPCRNEYTGQCHASLKLNPPHKLPLKDCLIDLTHAACSDCQYCQYWCVCATWHMHGLALAQTQTLDSTAGPGSLPRRECPQAVAVPIAHQVVVVVVVAVSCRVACA